MYSNDAKGAGSGKDGKGPSAGPKLCAETLRAAEGLQGEERSADRISDMLITLERELRIARDLDLAKQGILGKVPLARAWKEIERIPIRVRRDSDSIKSIKVLSDGRVAVLDTDGLIQLLAPRGAQRWDTQLRVDAFRACSFEVTPQGGIAAVLENAALLLFEQVPGHGWTRSSWPGGDSYRGAPGFEIRAHDTGFYTLSFGSVTEWLQQGDGSYSPRILFELAGLKRLATTPGGGIICGSVTRSIWAGLPDERGGVSIQLLGNSSGPIGALGVLPDGRVYHVDTAGELCIFELGAKSQGRLLARQTLHEGRVLDVQQAAGGLLVVHGMGSVQIFEEQGGVWCCLAKADRALPQASPRKGDTELGAVMAADGRIFAAVKNGLGQSEVVVSAAEGGAQRT